MLLTRKKVGVISFPDGKVDVTDPTANSDTWCRRTVEVHPGKYTCYAYEGKHPLHGSSIWISQIVTADPKLSPLAEEMLAEDKDWEKAALIGTESGLAGFFNQKPDLPKNGFQQLTHYEVSDGCFLCHHKGEHKPENGEQVQLPPLSRDAFWTASGAGDGLYEVWALRDRSTNETLLLEIRFDGGLEDFLC